MTAPLADSGQLRLPAWRLVAGLAVLGILVALLIMAALVYVDNFVLDRYMRALAEQSATSGLSDADIANCILERAKQLDLPVRRGDIGITRSDGRPHIQIARYGVQTYFGRMDLRLPEASSR